jgi:hypothetical protein
VGWPFVLEDGINHQSSELANSFGLTSMSFNMSLEPFYPTKSLAANQFPFGFNDSDSILDIHH